MDVRAHVVALNEKRLRINNEYQGYIDDCQTRHPGETFSGEEHAKLAEMDAAIDGIDAEVRLFVDRETREADNAALREAHGEVFGSGALDRSERSERQRLASWILGEERDSGDWESNKNAVAFDLQAVEKERQLLRDGASPEEVRTLLWDTGSIASGVPTVTARSIYSLMTAGIAAMRMPTTVITSAEGGPIKFPRVNAHGIGTQVIAQGTAIGGTDETFAALQLDAYKYGQLVQLASETIQDVGFDVVGHVSGNIARAVAQVIDADLIVGTGSGEPQGMMTAVTVGANGTVATGGSLITPTYENLVDVVYGVNDQYRQSPGVAWLMRDATAANLRKLRDGAGGTVGAVLWEPSLFNGIQTGQPDRLLSYPVYTDPNVASSASNARILAFGDWNAYYTRLVGNFVIERSDEYAFNTDLITFRGKQRIDGDFIDLTAVVVLKQSV